MHAVLLKAEHRNCGKVGRTRQGGLSHLSSIDDLTCMFDNLLLPDLCSCGLRSIVTLQLPTFCGKESACMWCRQQLACLALRLEGYALLPTFDALQLKPERKCRCQPFPTEADRLGSGGVRCAPHVRRKTYPHGLSLKQATAKTDACTQQTDTHKSLKPHPNS